MTRFAQKDLVSKQQRDTAEQMEDSACSQRKTPNTSWTTERGFRPEEVEMAQARISAAQATLEKMQHGKPAGDVQATSAELAYEEARFRERQVLAPTAATVEVLDVRPGDLIAPNTPVATFSRAIRLRFRIYVPKRTE